MNRPTVGSVATDLLRKQATDTHSADEQMAEQLADYDKSLHECIERCKKEYASDFFVVVLTKRETLLTNVIRNYFYGRLTCPTPDYDQAVYLYRRAEEAVDFVWVVPSRDACHHLKDNAASVVLKERELLNFVLAFADGTLYRLAKKLNGENAESIILEGA